MVEVKICGVCRPRDAAAAARAGATYVGVVLAPGYSRTQSPERAAEIFGAAPAQRVGVFVNASTASLIETAERLGLDVLQLHGAERPEMVEEARAGGDCRVWKVLRPRGRADFLDGVATYAGVADGILLDGWVPHTDGGAGARFPWSEIETVRDSIPEGVRLIVAGGLAPENVAEAVRRFAPDVVDVSSGVENVAREKSAERMKAFIAAARGRQES